MPSNETLLKAYLAHQRLYCRTRLSCLAGELKQDAVEAADLTRWARLYPFATTAAVAVGSGAIARWMIPPRCRPQSAGSRVTPAEAATGPREQAAKPKPPVMSLSSGLGALASSLLLGAGRMVLMQFLSAAMQGSPGFSPPHADVEDSFPMAEPVSPATEAVPVG